MRHLVFVVLGFLQISAATAQVQLLPGSSAPRVEQRLPPQNIAAPVPAQNSNFPRRLKQSEMQALFFNGLPIEARGLGRDTFTVTFFPNGKAQRVDAASKEKVQGKWYFLHDAYCSKWEKKPESCFTIVKDGDLYKVVRGTRAIAFWTAPVNSQLQ